MASLCAQHRPARDLGLPHPLDIALVDEASMLEARQLGDLQEIFGLVVLFGDPAQLPPVKSGRAEEGMV
ncbi:MAG: AAA family ATPase, partial [Pseudomonadota bacterium]